MRSIPQLIAAALLAAAPLLPGAAPAAEVSEITIADLLTPCMEGDNDSRWGQLAELECEQYVLGFTDAIALQNGEKAGICLPDQGRDDLVRRAFAKWAYANWSRRGEPAAVGLMETLKTAFACK